MVSPRLETAEFWDLPGLTAERREAVRDTWGAIWSSRLAIWAAGLAAVLAFGWSEHNATRLDPLYLTLPFALWTEEHGRYRRVRVGFAVLLAASSALFVEWVVAP